MHFYLEIFNLFNQKLYSKFAVSCILIYTLRFLDFAIILWLLTNISKSPSDIGLIVFIKFIPLIFSGIISGWIVDKISRLAVIRFIIILMSIYLFSWAIYMYFFSPNLISIYLFTFFSGILMSVDIASRSTYMSSLLKKRLIRNGIILNVIFVNLAWFIGPNIGMFFLEIFQFEVLYFILSIINFLGLFLLWRMPSLKILKSEKEAFAGIKSGINFALSKPIILGTILLIGIGNLTGFTFESMTPYFAKYIFQASPKEFSFMVSLQGLGALFGSILLFPFLLKISRPGLILSSSTILLCIGSIIFTFTNTFILGSIILFILGIFTCVFMNMHTRIILTQTPNPLRGRIQGLSQFSIGLFPIGSLITGLLADNIGIFNSMKIISSIGIILIVIIIFFFKELRNKIE
ncbi:MAG: MFS transporter [Dehalococcoidales bacterium]|nr:MFS transporter [Dehalococcoidales bacterium]